MKVITSEWENPTDPHYQIGIGNVKIPFGPPKITKKKSNQYPEFNKNRLSNNDAIHLAAEKK